MIVGTLYIVAQWVMEGHITAKQSGICSLLSVFPPPSLHWALLPRDAVHYEVVADNSSRTAHPLSQPILLELLPSNAEVPAVGPSWKRESKDLPLSPSRRIHDMENALAAWNKNTDLEILATAMRFLDMPKTCRTMQLTNSPASFPAIWNWLNGINIYNCSSRVSKNCHLHFPALF